jgi:acyl-coenzyme A thioesterase PaaI-like protein
MGKQPNSRSCFVCGRENPSGLNMTFYETAPGEVVAEYTVSEEYQGYPGVVHGGIVASMLDEASGRSQMGSGPSRFMFTAQLSIRYRKPVPVGQPLKILGHAGESKGRIAKATGEIFGPDGLLLAQADTVLVDIPPEKLPVIDPSVLDWHVDPDEEELV